MRLVVLDATAELAETLRARGDELVLVQRAGSPVQRLVERNRTSYLFSVDFTDPDFPSFVDKVLRPLSAEAAMSGSAAALASSAVVAGMLNVPQVDPPDWVPANEVGAQGLSHSGRLPVLVINRNDHSSLFDGERCLLPLDYIEPHLVTHSWGGVDGLDPALFPHSTVTDIRDEHALTAVCEWIIAHHGVRHIIAMHEMAVLPAARLRSKFGLAGLDLETAMLFRDKVRMKEAVASAGVPVPAWSAVDTRDDLNKVDWHTGRRIIKPRRGVGSQGTLVVDSLEQARAWWDATDPEPGHYEVEDFIEGTMYHCDSVVENGRITFAAVSEYVSRPGDYGAGRMAGSMHVAPGPLTDRILDLNCQALAALGLPGAVTHLELFHTADDRLIFLEVGARPGGGGIERYLRHAYGVDIVEAAIRLEVGLPALPNPLPDPDTSTWGVLAFYPGGGVVDLPLGDAQDLRVVEHRHTPTGTEPRHCADYRDRYVLAAPSRDDFMNAATTLRRASEPRTVHIVQPGTPVEDLAGPGITIFSVDLLSPGYAPFAERVLKAWGPATVVTATAHGSEVRQATVVAGEARKQAVLVLNRLGYRWMFDGDRCLLPLDHVEPHLITVPFGVEGHDPALFPNTMVDDFADERRILALADWIIETHRVTRVVALEERVMLPAAALRARHGLAGMRPDEAMLFRDKIKMKSVVADSGIAVPGYHVVDTIADLGPVEGTMVLKGRFGAGSDDVHVVTSLAEAEAVWRQLAPRPGRYEIEEFIEGAMYHCDAVVLGGRIVFAGVCEYLRRPGDFGSAPVGGSLLLRGGELRRRIVDLNERALTALGIRDGVTHLELFHTDADELVFCEVAGRPAGGGIDRVYHLGYGVNLIETALRIECGLPVTVPDLVHEDTMDGPVWAILGFFPTAGASGISPDRFDALGIVEHEHFVWSGHGGRKRRHSADYRDRYIVTAPHRQDFPRLQAAIEGEYHQTADDLR